MFTKCLYMLFACLSMQLVIAEITPEILSTTSYEAIFGDSEPQTTFTDTTTEVVTEREGIETTTEKIEISTKQLNETSELIKINKPPETIEIPSLGESKAEEVKDVQTTTFNNFINIDDDERIAPTQSPDDDDVSTNFDSPTQTVTSTTKKTIDPLIDNSLSQTSEEIINPCDSCDNYTFNSLKYEIKENQVQISWDEFAQQNENCNYKFEKRLKEIGYIRHENFTGATISTRNLCGNYIFHLTAINLCDQNITTELPITVKANTFRIKPSSTSAFSATLDIHSSNCPLDNFTINCTKGKENHNFEGPSDNGTQYILNELTPFSNYSCKGYLYVQDLLVGDTKFSIHTQETAPSEVKNLKVVNVTAESLTITWEPPESIPGILRGYEIILEESPMFDAPRFCNVATYNHSTSLPGSENSYIVLDFLGNYEYKFKIRATTNDFGPATTITAKTFPLISEVENLNYNIDIPKLNVPVIHLRWTYPCAIHTAIENIVFSIHISEEDKTIEIVNKTVTEDEFLENLTIDISLVPSKNYTISIYTINRDLNLKSHGETLSFKTPNGNTTAPLKPRIETTHDLLIINWEAPEQVFGELLHYQLNVTPVEYLHKINCYDEQPSIQIQLNETKYYYFARPHRKYLVEIAAVTTQGIGFPAIENCTTQSSQSKSPRNLTCDVKYPPARNTVIIRYHEPCDFNGIFDHYGITLIDEQGHQQKMNETSLSHLVSDLKPDMQYVALVSTITEGNRIGKEAICQFKSFAGIPKAPQLKTKDVIINVYDKRVDVLIKSDYFQDDQGEVKYFAILVGMASKWDDGLVGGDWNGYNWPNNEFWNTEGITYQATPSKWEPLHGSVSVYLFTLGVDNCTGTTNEFCNGPLVPDTEYNLAIRGYTVNGYQISNKLSFRTHEDYDKTKNVVMIIGIVAGMLVMVIVGAIACLYWKRRPPKPTTIEEANQVINTVEQVLVFPEAVEIEEFPAFYNHRKAALSEEFESLSKIGMDLTKNDGAIPENRKKNRYINILPYDCSRVPLQASKSDYINASYIKGYSGEIEYIATQGPLESTAADFWLMVMNENCSVVAMVAQFEEQKKSKCYRYFPERREQMELEMDDGTELMVRCSYELNFDFYIERQILVQANNKQLTVTHLQFLNWPDFGCPDGTTNMLQFTKRLRRHMEKNDSVAVIHCSAGVGRTGTLVAVDILLQTIKDGKDIDIYGTVAELRKQRTKMVQAETQYLYVYKCILDEILQPVELTEIKPIDPIYENLENLMEMKVMSKDNNNCDVAYRNENEQSNEKDTMSSLAINEKENQVNTLKNEDLSLD